MQEKTNVTAQKNLPATDRRVDVAAESVLCDCQQEYTLPDYMPEISRVLRVDARPVSFGRYIGGSEAEFTGSIVYTLLYCGEDGNPAAATLNADCEFKAPLGDAADKEELTVYEECEIENTVLRPTGPRTLSVRSRVKCVPHFVYREEEPEPLTGEHLEKLTFACPVLCEMHFESGEFGISGTVRAEGSEDAEVLCSFGDVVLGELRRTAEGISCAGDLCVTILYSDVEGGRRTLRTARQKAPFRRTVPLSCPDEGMNFRGYGRCVSLDVVKGAGEYTVDAVIALFGDGMKEEKQLLVCDAFSRVSPVSVSYRQKNLRRAVLCKNMNLSTHAQKKLTGESTGATELCTVFGSATTEGSVIRDGKLTLSGNLLLESAVSVPSERGVRYVPVGITLPFKCESDVLCEAEKPDVRCVPTVGNIRCRIEGDTLYADAELYLSVCVTGGETVRIVSEVKPEEGSIGKGDASVVLYYPDEGETLWSVSKKYGVSPSHLARQNGISDDRPDGRESLSGVRVLMIR